jgi:hypothetical protein
MNGVPENSETRWKINVTLAATLRILVFLRRFCILHNFQNKY